ncbi:hypothetical protein CQW23_18237 [Capsicum baccatum]|uniref:Uncharacterized protein n=1 Tax=Capsicum baccatum TaxID=33114 RepID=A0A2G2WG63_CAPBA|nr:hypothetical protein CQW23_18237 [Capsicum baccatum]
MTDSESSFWQAEKIANSDDLLREIFIRLPAISILCIRSDEMYHLDHLINFSETAKKGDVPSNNIRKFTESVQSVEPMHCCNGLLCLNLLQLDNDEKDYSKWFVKYVVDVDDLSRLFPIMLVHEPESLDVIGYQFDALCFLDDEKDGKTMLVLSLPEKILFYDIKNKNIKELVKVPLEGLHLNMNGFLVYNYKWYHAYKYVETLAFV